ncbi:MAG: PEP-CTERM sorting domain-containing protein [Planctomycetota bacterium]
MISHNAARLIPARLTNPSLLIVVSIVVATVNVQQCEAGVVTLRYGGVFTNTGGIFTANTEFFGELTYDTTATPISVAGNRGAFPGDAFQFSVLGNQYTSAPPLLFVQDALPGTSFDQLSKTITGYSGPPTNGAQLFQIDFSLTDQSGTAFDSLELPRAINLADFQQTGDVRAVTTLWTTASGFAVASGEITSLTITGAGAVPEPSCMAVFAVGLLAGTTRRKRNRVT